MTNQPPDDATIEERLRQFLDDRDYFERGDAYVAPAGFDKEMLFDHFITFAQSELTHNNTRLREALKAERERREELEVVAAALYLGHDDAKTQFDVYKSVYLTPPAR